MSDPKYLRDDYEHCLAHLIEELGECTAAAGKNRPRERGELDEWLNRHAARAKEGT